MSEHSLISWFWTVIGPSASGQGSAPAGPVSPRVQRSISRRLYECIDARTGNGGEQSESAESAMRIAAYSDGNMDGQERAQFEKELVSSVERREELIRAAEWLDEIDSKRESAPEHLIRQAIALNVQAPQAQSISWKHRLSEFLASLTPQTRWQVLTHGVTAVLFLVVGITLTGQFFASPQKDIVVQLNPPSLSGETLPDQKSTVVLPTNNFWDETTNLTIGRVAISEELANALIAYYRSPSPTTQHDLLAILGQSKSLPIGPIPVKAIAVEPEFIARLSADPTTRPAILALKILAGGIMLIGSSD